MTLAAVSLFAASALLASPIQSPQDPQSPSPTKKDAAAPTPATNPSDAQKPPSLKDAVHQKKVLTEDDLHPQPKHNDDSSDDRDFNRVCNPLCEQLVRDQVQTDRDSELEFRNQFALATHEIGNDLKWGAAFADARNAAEDYCDLERTKAKYAYPRSTAPYTSDKMPYDFIVKERDAYYKFKEMEDRVKVRFLAVRQTDTFRSTVMQTSWDVALARTCRDVEHL